MFRSSRMVSSVKGTRLLSRAKPLFSPCLARKFQPVVYKATPFTLTQSVALQKYSSEKKYKRKQTFFGHAGTLALPVATTIAIASLATYLTDDAPFKKSGRSIVLFADEWGSDRFQNAFHGPCIKLLQSPSSCMLMNATTWHNILRENSNNIAQINIAQLLNQWDVFEYSLSKTFRGVLLFVPKKWQAQKNNINKNLGIDLRYFNHIESPVEAYFQLSNKPEDYTDRMLCTVKALFLARESDAQANKFPWIIYAVGHGGPRSFDGICGMKPSSFQAHLDHFRHISTKIFVYTSCYAGDTKNLGDLYATKKYDFPIVCTSFNESQATIHTSKFNFQTFAQKVNTLKLDQKNAFNLLSAISSIIPCNRLSCLPRIRWAYQNAFEVLGSAMPGEMSLFSLADISSNNRQHFFILNQPIVESLSTEDIYIPFGRNNSTIAIASDCANNNTQYIGTMRMPQFKTPKEILACFSHAIDTLRLSSTSKIYIIDSITHANNKKIEDVMIFNNVKMKALRWNVQIPENTLFYKSEGKYYMTYQNEAGDMRTVSVAQWGWLTDDYCENTFRKVKTALLSTAKKS